MLSSSTPSSEPEPEPDAASTPMLAKEHMPSFMHGLSKHGFVVVVTDVSGAVVLVLTVDVVIVVVVVVMVVDVSVPVVVVNVVFVVVVSEIQ